MISVPRRLTLGLIVALGAAACGDDVTVSETPAPTPVVRAVVVSPSAATVGLPGSFTFGAAVDADAGLATTVTWSSSNPGVATVVNGVATAASAGTASICATSTVDANKSSCAQLTVVAPPPAAITSVEVTPMSASIPTGGTFTFVASVQATGNAARTVTWSSSNTNIATVNGGVVTAGNTPGSVAICAASTVDANFRTCVSLTVVGSTATVRSVNVTPSSANLLRGESVTLGASVDADAGVARTVTWSSSNPSIATVTSAGVVTASATNTGVTAVCAASTVDNNIRSCAQITVTTPPAPTPAQIAIQSITVGGNLAAPVNVNNVAGQIDVTVIVTPNDQQVSAVDILVDDQVASTQTFTAQDAEALSGNLTGDARTVTLSFDTRALNASNQPRYGNGNRIIRARLRVAAGQGATGADALQTLTFNNIDRLLIQTAPVGASNTADDANGLRWTRTQGGYGGTVTYVSYSGRTPATITIRPFCNGGPSTLATTVAGFVGSWSRTAAQMVGYVTGDTLCDIALGELPTVIGLTMTDGNPAPADIMTNAATSAENMPARRRLDNAAPTNMDVVNNLRSAPAADGWMNATYNIATATPTTTSTDAGVGFPTTNRRTWYYFGCGQGSSSAPIQFDGTGANIPECESDRTNNAVYTILYIERDALGNETTLPSGSRRNVGVDKTAPTARWSTNSNPNQAIRNTAGTLIPEFRDIGSGMLATSAVSGHQVLGSRAQFGSTRPNSLGCYRLDGSAPGTGNPAAPSGTDPFGTTASGCNSLLLTSSLSALGSPNSDGWRTGENLAAGILNNIIRLHVFATDRAGNASEALTRSILVDNTNPDAATVTSIPTAFTTTQPVVTVEYQDNVKVTGGALRMSYDNGVVLRYPFAQLSQPFGVPLNAINLSQQMTPNYPGVFIIGLSSNFSAPTSRVSGVQASISDAQSNLFASAVDPVPTQYVTLPTGSVTATSFAVLSALSSGSVQAQMNTGSVNGSNPFSTVHFYRRLADGSWQYYGQQTSPVVSDVSIFDQTKILTWSVNAADRARSETSTALVDAAVSGDVMVAIGVRSNGAGHLTTATTIGMPNALASLSASITSTNVRGPSQTYNTANSGGTTTNTNILPTYISGLDRTNITNGMQLTITRGTVVRNNIGGLPSTNTVTYACSSSNTLRATVVVSGSDCVVTGGQESGPVTITWSATAGAVAGTTANTVSAATSLVNTGDVAVALELFGNSTWIAPGGTNVFDNRTIYAPGASVSIIGQVVRPSNISAGGYTGAVAICQTDRPDLVTVTPGTTTIASVNYPTCNITSNVPLTTATEVNVALRVNLPAENGLSAVTFEQSRKLTLTPSAQATSMNTSNGPLALARPTGTPTTSSVVGAIVRNVGAGTAPAINGTCSSDNTSVVTVPSSASIAGDIATCAVSLGTTHGSATVTITVNAPAYTIGNTTVAAQTFTATRTFTVLNSQVSVASTVLARNVLATPFTPVTHLGGAASRTFSVSPALPAGLTMNASTGQITGTPTVASAATTYTVTITDAGGAVAQTRTFSLTVSDVLTATTNAPAARIFNASGSTITFTPVSASGGTAPYTFALTGEFPGTLALNTSTGVVSGIVATPTNTTVSYTVVVTDALGEQAQASFTLRINPTLTVAANTTVIQLTEGQTLATTTVATASGGSPAIVASPLTSLFGLTRSFNSGTGQYQLSGTATSNNNGVAQTQTASFTDAISTPAVTSNYTVAVWPSIATTVVTPNVTLTAGVAYSGTTVQPVTATGGRPALSYTVAPALPAGVTMNSANGAITGTPSIAASGQTYTVTVTDANGATAQASFELAVAGSPPNAPAAPTAAAASSTSATVTWVAPAQGGAPISAYEVQWALASAPTTWIGTQSTGNVLNTTVTGLTAGQSYVFRVAASNAFGQSAFSGASASVTLPLPPTIAPNQTPFAWTAGHPITGYTPAIGSNGQAPRVYSLTGSTPPGLTINASTGAVTGTPTTPGVYNFNVVYTDALSQSATQAVQLTVNAANSLSPATQTLEFTVNSPYNLNPLTPAGGTGTPPYAWSVSPALPTGLTLNAATGNISGTPTVVIQPVTAYTVTITDAVGATATATLNIVTGNPPAAPLAPTVQLLSSTSAAVTWVAPASPDAPISVYNIEYQNITDAPGVWVSAPNVNHPTVTTNLTGLIPNKLYNVRVRAVSVFGAGAFSPPSVNFNTPATLAAAFNYNIVLTQGVAMTGGQGQPVSATGGIPPYAWSVSPALPAGLSLNAATGQITGTPTAAQGATNYTMTINDAGADPNATQGFTITINAPLTTTLVSSGYVLNQGTLYTNLQPVTASGGTAPITWGVSPALPTGLSLNPATGQISGTPTATQIGTDYTLTATEANGSTSSKVVNIAIIGGAGIFATATVSGSTVGQNGGGEDWSNLANALAAGGGSATVNFTGSDQSEFLNVTNFGLAIPGGATILGINVIVSRNQSGPGARNIEDDNIELTKNGTTSVGSNLAVGGTWPASLTDITYAGGLWGTTWTPAEVNAATFGVRIRVEATGGGGSRQANIDHVRVQVIYLVP